MSYNILKKNVKFSGPVSGTIEGMVDASTDQTIGGQKTFSHTLTSSADVMVSGSGKVSASFFYGDGSSLSGVSGVPSGTDGNIQFTDGSALGASSNLTFFTSSNKLEVLGDISASINISASAFYGDGTGLTNVAADSVLSQNIIGQLSASQISHSSGLTNSGDNLIIDLGTNGGIAESTGLKLELGDLSPYASAFSNNQIIVISGSGAVGNKSVTLGWLGDNILINAGNIDGGTINNARLPNALSASVGVSSSFFQGDGSGLTNVTSAPTPTGSNTEIQFNADGILGATTNLTFLTGSNTLATSNLSASVNISGSSLYLQDEIYVGGQAFLDIETNVAANNASFTEITASSTISSSADVYGAAFIGDGRQLIGLPITNAASNAVVTVVNATTKTVDADSNFTYDGTDLEVQSGYVKATNLSASADLQVGGHITGSVIHTNGGITMPDGGGGTFTFLSDQGNVTAGSITMIESGNDVLNFNDNSISGSGNISGSAFYGDGSNLTNMAAPTYRYAYFTNNSSITTSARFVDWLGPSNQASLANMRGGIIIAPTSGSIVRVSFSPTDNVLFRSDGDEMIVAVTRNAINTLSLAQANGKQLIGATGSFNRPISYYDDAAGTTNTFTGEIDFVNGNVTGSNSFDPGDILGFAFRTPDGTTNLCGITLVLKFEES